jgi:hypothetical protein
MLARVLSYQYPLARNLKRSRSARDLAKVAADQTLFLAHKLRGATPIVKDPIALFSAEWLASTFGFNVFALIRHPAAFCASIKVKNWQFDFNHFTRQPALMQGYVREFSDQIQAYARHEADIIDQAMLLWNCIHNTIYLYQQRHPEWIFERHEDLSRDPLGNFRRLYGRLGLEFTERAAKAILDRSGSHNPTEQQLGHDEFRRNSKANIYNWKHRLSRGEIARIRQGTEEISSHFYTPTDW